MTSFLIFVLFAVIVYGIAYATAEIRKGYMKRMILPYDPAHPGLLETTRLYLLSTIEVEIKDVSLETAKEILNLIRLRQEVKS